MDKKKLKKIIKYASICLGVLLFIFLITNQTALADVGNNNRYDSGSSDFDSDGGDGLAFLYIFDLLFRLIFMFGPIPGTIICIILVVIFIKLGKSGKLKSLLSRNSKTNNVNNYTSTNNTSNYSSDEVASKVRETDPNFSEDKFIGWTREVFIKLQQAWTDRNWKIIRPFESEELFNLHNTQLEEYIKNNKINVIEKINVSYCALTDFRVDGDKEVMTVELHAIMRDYVIDATSKKVLESDPNKDWNMQYIMTFNRKIGVKTHAGTSNKSTTNCPNCGAPTEITSAGQCSYCGSVITTGEHDWVLTDIRSK